MKKFLPLLTLIILMFFLAGVAFAVSDVKLTVGSATTGIDQPVTIQIKAEPTGATTSVAGAAFTLQYNSALTVNVNSDFFDTFVNQGFTTEDGLEADGTIDSYSQPLVINSVASGADTLLKIAAARKDAGTISGPTVLFTLEASSSTQGTYSITLIPTNIDNDAAGYTTPQDIDLLIGAEAVGSADEFPVRLFVADADNNSYVVGGQIVVTDNGNDSDSDGIIDIWEISNFGDLTTADSVSDFDQDGYSDLTEYQNFSSSTNDPEGNPYDPKVVNAPFGSGFVSTTVTLNLNAGWNLISLPVVPQDASLTSIFPDVLVAWQLTDVGYVNPTSLEPGMFGYWVKVPSDADYTVTGQKVVNYQMSLSSGWSLVGAPSGTATPNTDPAGKITVMWGLDNTGYFQPTQFVEGFGYWVKVSENCNLILSSE